MNISNAPDAPDADDAAAPEPAAAIDVSSRRCGLVAIVGRPNVGKSTKTNCELSTVRMPVMRCRVVCALAEVILTF